MPSTNKPVRVLSSFLHKLGAARICTTAWHQLEFAASLRPDCKVLGGETRRALKAAFAKVLPEEILTRRKSGFPVPFNRWLRGPLAGRVRELLLSGPARHRGLYRPGVVELWHRRFLEAAS